MAHWSWKAAAIVGWTLAAGLGAALLGLNDRLRLPSARPAATGAAWLPTSSKVRVDLLGVDRLKVFADQLAKAHDKPAFVHWEQINSSGLGDPDSAIRFDVVGADCESAFRLLNSQLSGTHRLTHDRLDLRVFDDWIEIGPASYFDRAESTVHVHEIADLVRSVMSSSTSATPLTEDQAVRAVLNLLQSQVSPDDWTDNGGELIRANSVGSALVITAPARVQSQVDWVLEQYRRNPGFATAFEKFVR